MTIVDRVGSAYLWQTAATPAVMALRARAWSLLGVEPGARVLDIGCGPGTALAGLATLVGPLGRVTGVDYDAQMVRLADRTAQQLGVASWVRHEVASAAALPFAPAAFDACYCERLLQHLEPEQAAAAVAEAARVLRPGGAAVFVDTDWASFSVDAGENELERRLQARNLARFRNPFAGRGLGRSLRAAGFGFVLAEPFAVPLTADSVARLLAGAVADAAADGDLTEAEQARWQAMLAERATAPGAAGHVTTIIAVGRRL